ncbi:MAG: hypothetical protein OER74_05685 [Desulfobacteraceae bacterium]|nr:hypothetical protein [Desulfobacteraceae bacterium]
MSAAYNGVISGRDFLSTPIVMTSSLTGAAHSKETAEISISRSFRRLKSSNP